MFKIYFSLCNIYVFLWTDLYLFSIFLFWGFFPLVNCRHLEQAASRLTPGDPHLVIFTSLCNPLSCLTRVGLREPPLYGRSDSMSFQGHLWKLLWFSLGGLLFWVPYSGRNQLPSQPTADGGGQGWGTQTSSRQPVRNLGFLARVTWMTLEVGPLGPAELLDEAVVPTDSLTAISSWETLIQNHPEKLLPDPRSLGTER